MNQPDLLQHLAGEGPADISGSVAQQRFAYQNCWGVLKIIEALQSGSTDFAVAFEYQNDILILDSDKSPTKVDFCQVKTKAKGLKKLSEILLKGKNPPLSDIGKLYSKRVGIIAKKDNRYFVISNAKFDCATDDNETCGSLLNDTAKQKIIKVLKQEIDNFDEAEIGQLYLHTSELPLKDTIPYLEGKAVELFRQKFGEVHTNKAGTWLRFHLYNAHEKSKNTDIKESTEVKDLLKLKCITSTEVLSSLDLVNQTSQLPEWIFFGNTLATEGMKPYELTQIQRAWEEIRVEILNPLNTIIQNIYEAIRKEMYAISDEEFQDMTYCEIIERIVKKVAPSIKTVSYSKAHFKALTLRAHYERAATI